MSRFLFVSMLVLAPLLGGCGALMGAATGLSRPVASSDCSETSSASSSEACSPSPD